MKKIVLMLLLSSVIIFQGCANLKGSDDQEKDISTSEQKVVMKIESTSIEVVNDKMIRVSVEAIGEDLEYAYYIYKNDELLEKIYYEESVNQLEYQVEENGLYKVRIFVRNIEGEKETKYTEEVNIEDSSLINRD